MSATGKQLDPVTLAVVHAQLEQIADEMDSVFERMAFSPVISDAWDRADGIYRPQDGAMIVQGIRGLPIFVGVMQFAVRSVLERCALAPGDVYLLNDPYLGGTHIMDVKMVRPVFADGELVAVLANTGHWPDLGGRVPGGFGAAATDVYQEGLRIPPIPLVRGGERDEGLMALLRANSRVADDLDGDVRAQLTALEVGERALLELIAEHGLDTFRACADELETRSERQMRDHVASIPDGEYRFVERMDGDGVVDAPLDIACRARVRGSQLVLDFSDSSPPCRGPMNSVLSATVSSCMVALLHLFPDVVLNAGAFAPVEIVAPPETFLAAPPPRPVAGCAAEVSQRIITAVHGALAQALPDVVPAASFATINNLALGGSGPDGSWVMYAFLGGGYGGHPHGDGLTNGCSLMSVARSQSIELLEARYPIRFHRFAVRDGSAGPGRHRGGHGIAFEFELLTDEAEVSLLGDRSATPPHGLHGGLAGAPAAPYLVIDGERVVLPHVTKGEGLRLRRGDRVALLTPGGGGFGPPRERPSADVARDRDDGYLTPVQLAQHGVVG